MWTLYKINVLRALKSGKYSKDPDTFATFLATEYDRCIKRGGDLLNGVPIINGNVVGMADVIKRALEKGKNSGGENFNLLQEIYPAAFDAYWNGAEMAPIPNPILRPLGWISTPPAPGAVLNIGPNPIALAQSAAKQSAMKAAAKAALDALLDVTVDIPPVGPVNVRDIIEKIKKGEPIEDEIKKHPAIRAAKSAYEKYEQMKKMKPGIGSQFKPAIKFPFPELPKRSKLIEEAKNKLKEQAVKVLKEQLKEIAKEAIATAIATAIMSQIQKYALISIPSATAIAAAGINQASVKKFVRDKMDGKDSTLPELPQIPDIPTLPAISIPDIPTAEELERQLSEKIPTEAEIKSMAEYMILDKIPKIPNIHFIPPTIVFSPSTNILVGPFVNLAKIHLLGTGGTMTVIAQYPPPAPPAPAILQWSAYNVPG